MGNSFSTASQSCSNGKKVIILGGGFAGLRIAYLLDKIGYGISIIEKSDTLGGMVQTFSRMHGGEKFAFDYGPHLFFEDFLKEYRELIGEDMLELTGMFKMCMDRGNLQYPLMVSELLLKSNPLVFVGYVLDYIVHRYRRRRIPDDNLESIMIKRFGRKLFHEFYLPYVEKCCGLPAHKVSALWARERENVSGKSLVANIGDKIKNHLSRKAAERAGKYNAPTSSSINAWYPRHGAGQLCDAMAAAISRQDLHLNAELRAVDVEGGAVRGVEFSSDGRNEVLAGDFYISTLPLPDLFKYFKPASDKNLEAAEKLRFRRLRLVNLIISKPVVTDALEFFSMQRGRIFKRLYEPKAMSAAMAPEATSSLCLEVCYTTGDEIDAMPDAELIDICIGNVMDMGLIATRAEVTDAFTKEMPHAYPIYEKDFEACRGELLEEIGNIGNLITTGRQGLFLYHAMTNEIMTMAANVAEFLSGGMEKKGFVCANMQWGRPFY